MTAQDLQRRTGFIATRHGVALLAALILSACAGMPTEAPPLPQAPAQWQAAETLPAPVSQAWLADFDAPVLDQLVSEALDNNHDLQAAAARMESARARARIAGAPLRPEAEIGFTAERGTSAGGASPMDDYGLEARISWEPDLWGRLGNAARAAEDDAQASALDYAAARLSLAAAVVEGWFSAMEAGQQLALAEHTQESFRRSLVVIEERYRRGLSGALDLRLARTDVAAAAANLAARQRDLDVVLRALEILLGRYPGAEIEPASQLPGMRNQVPAGLPSQLLARRPDLAAAERRLSAAGERLEEARKNRLPSLRLTARGGAASDELRNILDGSNLLWNLLAGLTLPLFQGGRLEAEQALARSQRREAWAGYAQTVLVAFGEVETALAAEARYREQEQALALATREARAAERLAESRYRQGLEGIITLLESRRRAFNAESTLLRVSRERLDNRVRLYLALGGGFAAQATAEDIKQE